MPGLHDIRQLYGAYEEEFRQLELARKPGDGYFGLGTGPRNYPCHQMFAQKLEVLLKQIAAASPSAEDAAQVLSWIYLEAVAERREQDAVYWMFLAAHSLTFPLIPLLTPVQAQTLYQRYRKQYPRWSCLPAQKEVLAALRTRGKT